MFNVKAVIAGKSHQTGDTRRDFLAGIF